jgi:hypothetical protein
MDVWETAPLLPEQRAAVKDYIPVNLRAVSRDLGLSATRPTL